MRVALGSMVVVLAIASPAAATCVGEEAPRWAAHQSIALLLNPMGAEHNLRIGLCVPLYASTDDALRANHFEVGVSSYLSPVYAIGGPYVQFSPATFFFARVELNAMGLWPIGLDGAGYFPMRSYLSSWEPEDTPASRAEATGGWNARFFSVLRGEIELGPVTLVGYDAFFVDYHDVGSAAYWLQVRHDLVTARSDWVVANEAYVLLGVPIPGGPEIRFGAYDALRDVPASGYVGHQIGGLVMVVWERPVPGIDELSIYVRVGGYTHHGVRGGDATTLGGASADHDLGGL
jgi:hypothetical protein